MTLNIHYSYTKLEVFNLYFFVGNLFFCWKDRLRISMQLNPHTQSVTKLGSHTVPWAPRSSILTTVHLAGLLQR